MRRWTMSAMESLRRISLGVRDGMSMLISESVDGALSLLVYNVNAAGNPVFLFRSLECEKLN